MNIACGAVILIVIVAMLIATIVYFVVNNKGSGGLDKTDVSAKKHRTQLSTSRVPQSQPQSRFAQPQLGQPMNPQAPPMPNLSQQDEEYLKKSGQLQHVQNFDSRKRQALLQAIDRRQEQPVPSIHKGRDYDSISRGDAKYMRMQTAQLLRNKNTFPFNLDESHRQLLQNNEVGFHFPDAEDQLR